MSEYRKEIVVILVLKERSRSKSKKRSEPGFQKVSEKKSSEQPIK